MTLHSIYKFHPYVYSFFLLHLHIKYFVPWKWTTNCLVANSKRCQEDHISAWSINTKRCRDSEWIHRTDSSPISMSQYLCHPAADGASEDMDDDSRLCMSVNVVLGDAEICLQENKTKPSRDGIRSQPSNFVDHDESIQWETVTEALTLFIKLQVRGTTLIQGEYSSSSPRATRDERAPRSWETVAVLLTRPSHQSRESCIFIIWSFFIICSPRTVPKHFIWLQPAGF